MHTNTLNGNGKRGRPPLFSEVLADKVLEELATGKSLLTVVKQRSMPSYTTVRAWIRDNPEFANKYALLKENEAEAFVEEMLQIADDSKDDYYEDEEGNQKQVFNRENVMRARLRVDTRKWIASKLLPKKYGEALAAHNVTLNNTVQNITVLTSEAQEELQRRCQEALDATAKITDGDKGCT